MLFLRRKGRKLKTQHIDGILCAFDIECSVSHKENLYDCAAKEVISWTFKILVIY